MDLFLINRFKNNSTIFNKYNLSMLGLILATDSNFGMALNGKIPWKNTQDLKWFKHVTTGKNLIMGTNTLKSLPKQSLPNRTINILSKNTNFK